MGKGKREWQSPLCRVSCSHLVQRTMPNAGGGLDLRPASLFFYVTVAIPMHTSTDVIMLHIVYTMSPLCLPYVWTILLGFTCDSHL